MFGWICKIIKNSNKLRENELSWVTLDGEFKQLQPISSSNILQLLNECSIEVGKPPGSLTRIAQPCDAWVFFKSIKTCLRHLSGHAEKSELNKKLSTIFKQHEAKVVFSMKSKHKEMAIEGLLDIQASMNKAITPAIIRQSFSETGMYYFYFAPSSISDPEAIKNNW